MLASRAWTSLAEDIGALAACRWAKPSPGPRGWTAPVSGWRCGRTACAGRGRRLLTRAAGGVGWRCVATTVPAAGPFCDDGLPSGGGRRDNALPRVSVPEKATNPICAFYQPASRARRKSMRRRPAAPDTSSARLRRRPVRMFPSAHGDDLGQDRERDFLRADRTEIEAGRRLEARQPFAVDAAAAERLLERRRLLAAAHEGHIVAFDRERRLE